MAQPAELSQIEKLSQYLETRLGSGSRTENAKNNIKLAFWALTQAIMRQKYFPRDIAEQKAANIVIDDVEKLINKADQKTSTGQVSEASSQGTNDLERISALSAFWPDNHGQYVKRKLAEMPPNVSYLTRQNSRAIFGAVIATLAILSLVAIYIYLAQTSLVMPQALKMPKQHSSH